jgi:hypothetical protein
MERAVSTRKSVRLELRLEIAYTAFLLQHAKLITLLTLLAGCELRKN